MGKDDKKYYRKRRKSKEQIYVPKCCQQPRSHGSAKRRTDFSLFFSSDSHSSSLLRGSRLELLRCKDNLSGITTVSMDEHEEMPRFPLVQCLQSQNGGQSGIYSNCKKLSSSGTNSSKKTHADTSNNGNGIHLKSEDAMQLLCSPNTSTSQVTTHSDVCATPGSTIWAKTACQMWWPAKVLGGRSTTVAKDGQVVDGHVLVQYFGNQELAWLDPAGDLSQFDQYFEERSCNPMEAFQDALKQALPRKENLTLCRQLDRSFDRVKSSSHRDQAADKGIESSSSRAGEEEDYPESGRGKRKRKPKIHFDEVTTFENKSSKKMRRFRIMRQLGLAAPIGSPFFLHILSKNCLQFILSFGYLTYFSCLH